MKKRVFGLASSPFGDLWLMWNCSGVCGISFDEPELSKTADSSDFNRDDAQASRLLESLLQTPSIVLECFNLAGTTFQRQVWAELLTIPAGAVTTYQELAKRIDRPKAVRAVANAVGANPIAWLVPCHRVIRSDGGLGGYRWGVERKRAILDWEQKANREAA
ncbi:MAG: methylated-DNA--[protein]-cysteine S-methyltransferase [Porticoccaceae bacterium]